MTYIPTRFFLLSLFLFFIFFHTSLFMSWMWRNKIFFLFNFLLRFLLFSRHATSLISFLFHILSLFSHYAHHRMFQWRKFVWSLNVSRITRTDPVSAIKDRHQTTSLVARIAEIAVEVVHHIKDSSSKNCRIITKTRMPPLTREIIILSSSTLENQRQTRSYQWNRQVHGSQHVTSMMMRKFSHSRHQWSIWTVTMEVEEAADRAITTNIADHLTCTLCEAEVKRNHFPHESHRWNVKVKRHVLSRLLCSGNKSWKRFFHFCRVMCGTISFFRDEFFHLPILILSPFFSFFPFYLTSGKTKKKFYSVLASFFHTIPNGEWKSENLWISCFFIIRFQQRIQHDSEPFW